MIYCWPPSIRDLLLQLARLLLQTSDEVPELFLKSVELRNTEVEVEGGGEDAAKQPDDALDVGETRHAGVVEERVGARRAMENGGAGDVGVVFEVGEFLRRKVG